MYSNWTTTKISYTESYYESRSNTNNYFSGFEKNLLTDLPLAFEPKYYLTERSVIST